MVRSLRPEEAATVWPENLQALTLFLAASDCWHHGGLSAVPMRFDLLTARAVWDLKGLPQPAPETFERLRCLTQAALEEIHQQVKEQQARDRT